MVILLLGLLLFSACSTKQTIAPKSLSSSCLEANLKDVTFDHRSKHFAQINLNDRDSIIITYSQALIEAGLMCRSIIDQNVAKKSMEGHAMLFMCIGEIRNDRIEKIQGELKQIGRIVLEKNEVWTCPDISKISQVIQKVSSCYEKRGLHEMAKQQLQVFFEDPGFNRCVSLNDAKQAERKLSSLKSFSTTPNHLKFRGSFK